MLAGQADFFLAAEQYNPAGLLAQQAEEARRAANAQYAQMASDAQAFADQNTAIWEALTANMEGLSDSATAPPWGQCPRHVCGAD